MQFIKNMPETGTNMIVNNEWLTGMADIKIMICKFYVDESFVNLGH